jgi:phage repressor protein C with HTH and peptisase S24 domain/DNA-binding XRE family transcriptional regulator
MRKREKKIALPEWAIRISGMRERLRISQGELARIMECSAMTVSRWERGLLAPSAEYYVRLGNLADPSECWFFWERAGIRVDKITRAMADPGSGGLPASTVAQLERASAGAAGAQAKASGRSDMVAVPMLKGVAGTHGVSGEKWMTLSRIPATRVIGTPLDWCPNPKYTSMLRVKGHSMEPLIRNNDILAVDSFQTERADLVGKIVVAANEEKGLCVSRLRRYEIFDVLESENHQYEGIVLNKTSGWHIVAKVLWWISAAP